MVDPQDATQQLHFKPDLDFRDRSRTVLRNGERLNSGLGLQEIRKYAAGQLATLPSEIRRFDNPHRDPAWLELKLLDLPLRLLRQGRAQVGLNREEGLDPEELD